MCNPLLDHGLRLAFAFGQGDISQALAEQIGRIYTSETFGTLRCIKCNFDVFSELLTLTFLRIDIAVFELRTNQG